MARQLLRDEHINCPGGKVSFELNWSQLPAGLYDVEAQMGNGTPVARKLVVR